MRAGEDIGEKGAQREGLCQVNSYSSLTGQFISTIQIIEGEVTLKGRGVEGEGMLRGRLLVAAG